MSTSVYFSAVATDGHLKTIYLMGQEMFAAVLTTTLFILSAATGGSAADSCTASLLSKGGDVCPASGDFVNGLRSNVSALLQSVVCCMQQLGHTPEYPANSCTELAEREPDISSGNYWILNSTRSPVQVFVKWVKCFHLVSMSPEAG